MNKCFNETGDIQYILHFPGMNFEESSKDFTFYKDLKFEVSPEISLISVFNSTCEDSILCQQCKNNNLNLINSDAALAVPDGKWYQPDKIDFILECLYKVNTKYALVMDSRDVIIVNDLTNNFISTFESLNTPFIFNAQPNRYPNIQIEPMKVYLYKSQVRFLNGGVSFGLREELIKFYEYARLIRDNNGSGFINNGVPSEQFFLRIALTTYNDGNYLIDGVDHGRKLISIIHYSDNCSYKNEDGDFIIKLKLKDNMYKGNYFAS